jgi:hypothetical protein
VIKQDHQVRTLKLWDAGGTGRPAVISIVHDLGYNKVYARWVPKTMTEEHKKPGKPSKWNFSSTMRMMVMLSHLTLSQVMKHGFTFITLKQSDNPWNGAIRYHQAKKFKCAEDHSIHVLDKKGILPVDFLDKSTIISSEWY